MAIERAMHSRCCWPPELVLDLVPQRRPGQRPLDALVHLALAEALEEAHAEGDVLVDRHRERRRLLEHHADLGADQRDVALGREQVLAVHHDLALGALLWIERVHAVQGAQQRRLAAARRTDDRGDLVLGDVERDVLQREERPVIEVEVPHSQLGGELGIHV
jgi:hypothetical protein